MRIAVVGAGEVGLNLAFQWSRRWHEVVLAYGRDPDRLLGRARSIGVRAAAPAEALAGVDAVLLATPWAALDDVAGRIVADIPPDAVLVDATNPYVGRRLVDVPGGSAPHVAGRFPGLAVARAFNTFTAGFQALVGEGRDGAVAMFHAATSAYGRDVAEWLVADAGFVPVELPWSAVELMAAPRRPGAVYGETYPIEAARRIAAVAGAPRGGLAAAAHLATRLRAAG